MSKYGYCAVAWTQNLYGSRCGFTMDRTKKKDEELYTVTYTLFNESASIQFDTKYSIEKTMVPSTDDTAESKERIKFHFVSMDYNPKITIKTDKKEIAYRMTEAEGTLHPINQKRVCTVKKMNLLKSTEYWSMIFNCYDTEYTEYKNLKTFPILIYYKYSTKMVDGILTLKQIDYYFDGDDFTIILRTDYLNNKTDLKNKKFVYSLYVEDKKNNVCFEKPLIPGEADCSWEVKKTELTGFRVIDSQSNYFEHNCVGTTKYIFDQMRSEYPNCTIQQYRRVKCENVQPETREKYLDDWKKEVNLDPVFKDFSTSIRGQTLIQTYPPLSVDESYTLLDDPSLVGRIKKLKVG